MRVWATSCVLLLCSAARADIVSRDAADFFKRARVIELVRVARVKPTLEITTVRVNVGRSPGAKTRRLPLFVPFVPRVGETLLRACGEAICVLGRDRGDHYLLYPNQGTPAEVRPGLVEKTALARWAAGKPAPGLCFKVAVRLVDEPHTTHTLRVDVRASDGIGKLATLQVDEGQVFLTLGRGSRSVQLSGPPPGPKRGPCHQLSLHPIRPPVRTWRAFRRARAGGLSRLVIARGAIQIRKPVGFLRRGTHRITVEHSRRRGSRFRCRLFRDTAPHQSYSKLSRRMLSFPSSEEGRYIGLVGGFPRGRDLLRLIEAVRPGTPVSWPVRLHGTNDAGEVVGRVTLRHVPDPR